MYRNEDVVGNTKIQIYCDSKTKFKREEDIVKYVLNKNEIKINFNMNPYKLKNFLFYRKFRSYDSIKETHAYRTYVR